MAKTRKPNVLAMAVVLVVFVTAIVMLNAWLVMLLWGALGGSFGFFTIGYSQAVLVSLTLSFIASFFRNSTRTVK